MSFFNKNDDAQIVEASDWSFKCKIVVTCKIKHLQNICKMLQCFILHVPSSKNVLQMFYAKTLAKVLQNIANVLAC